MTGPALRSVLELLTVVKRQLGATALHVQAFDLSPDIVSTMVVEGGLVFGHGSAAIELEHKGVTVTGFSREPAAQAAEPAPTVEEADEAVNGEGVV